MAILKNTTVDSTGALQLPVGTTAQRPTAETGYMRYNSTLKKVEIYNGTAWTQLPSTQSIVTSELVLYLDAGNTSSYPGSGTTWTDLSGNGNNGTLVNGVGYDSGNGGSLTFDGSNDYVNCPITKTASCTFCCWAKTTTVAGIPMLFNAGPNGSGPDLIFYNGKISWNVWNGDTNSFGTMPATVTNGNWHYYVVVNDASAGAKLYYDGSLFGSTSYANASANTNLTIGGNTSTYMWNGSISIFKLYNRSLSESEVIQNFNATKTRFGL